MVYVVPLLCISIPRVGLILPRGVVVPRSRQKRVNWRRRVGGPSPSPRGWFDSIDMVRCVLVYEKEGATAVGARLSTA